MMIRKTRQGTAMTQILPTQILPTQILTDTDPTDTDPTDTDPTDTDPTDTDPCADECPYLESESPDMLSSSLAGSPDMLSSSLAGSNKNERYEADKFHLNSEDIALELSSLTPLQIGEYPISDLSDIDLKLALSFLDPADLGKVLQNISVQDLVVVKERLGETKFNEFLSKVSVSDREVLENTLAILRVPY